MIRLAVIWIVGVGATFVAGSAIAEHGMGMAAPAIVMLVLVLMITSWVVRT